MWNNMAPWYSSRLAAANVPLAHSLIFQLGNLNGKSILETHAGDGRIAELLLTLFPTINYQGCDFSSVMIDMCKSRFTKNIDDTKNPNFWEGNSMDLVGVQDDSLGAYLANLGGCCVADLSKMLSEAHRVLEKGGRAALSLRNEGSQTDTFFRLIAEALKPFGYPEYATREGLWVGHDSAKLRQRVLESGFQSAIAWTAVVPLPVYSTEDFLDLAKSMGGVKAVLGKLEPSKYDLAVAALSAAASDALTHGAIQIAVGCVVATK